MAFRTETQIQADLTLWYAARTEAAAGRSFTLVTSAGTRILTGHNIREINEMISSLQRELLAAQIPDGGRQGLHSFALANLGDNGANK